MLLGRRAVVAPGNSSQSGTGWGAGGVSSDVQPFFSDDFDGLQENDSNGVTRITSNALVSVVSFAGRNALRYRYGTGVSSVESRINLGRNVTTFALDCDIHVPSNFAHVSGNNKLFRLWGDDYVTSEQNYGDYGKMGASFWASTNPGPSKFWFDYSIRGNGSSMSPDPVPTVESFFDASWQNQWTRLRLLFKHVSSDNAGDGVMKMWKNDTLLASRTNINNSTSALQHWNTMYLMGYANGPYSVVTDFHFSRLRFYDTDPGWV